MKINEIIMGDTLSVLKTWPDNVIDCIITSPPYWSLRSYLPKDHPDKPKEIGLEPTFKEYLNKLFAIFEETKRVLKPTGSLWVNMGDSYGTHASAGGKGQFGLNMMDDSRSARSWKKPNLGYEKSLIGQPWRLALKLIDDGKWILRADIIWAKQIYFGKERKTKGSAMPSSVKDRVNMTHEHLFHFTKSKKYFYDLDAVRIKQQTFEDRPDGFTRSREFKYNSKFLEDYSPQTKQSGHRFNYRVQSVAAGKIKGPQFKASEEEIRNYRDERAKKATEEKMITFYSHSNRGEEYNNPNGKNIPSVWLIGTEPSKELHFAKFPEGLVEIPIKSTCPKDGIVCDIFMGSGTVAKVARYLGRNFVGIELNGEYIKLAEKRLAQQVLG